ncbi:MAG TPA: hypothetical protein EYP52_02000 [Anaerolineae bacterium]|nr:hypothetical protein [Anaerolineae bacterium]
MGKITRCGLLIVLVAMLSACGGKAGTPPPTAVPPTPTSPPPPPTPTPIPALRQWAVEAFATSEYDNPDWSARQATGAPDTAECVDATTAWASAQSDTVEQLDLYYETPVYATEINIYQTYNPDQVAEIALIDAEGNFVPVLTQEPHYEAEPCPYVLTVQLDEPTDYLVQGVRLTVDQSVLQTWNEIDAVELVGIAGEGEVVRPAPPPTPTPFPPPEGFLWRIGGEQGIGADQFAYLGGMDADVNNLIYVADNTHGIWALDTDGNVVNRIDHGEMSNPTDVKVGPDGNLYVAAWGSNQVFVFTPGGAPIARWGEPGTGEGQFGDFGPDAVAVGLDGTVYVLDSNEDESGNEITRVQKFTADGIFLGAFLIPEEFLGATAMNVGPDGNLYVVDWIGDEIVKFDTDGNILGRIGGTALAGAGPQSLDFDAEGNMVLAVWSPAGVVELDPTGNLLAWFGVAVGGGSQPWPEGGFYSPSGAAILLDGSRAFASDSSGDHAYITAFQFER